MAATSTIRRARAATYVTGGNEQSWIWHRDNVFAGRVRSLSGRTRAWLGGLR